MKITLVILNYNIAGSTIRLLESLRNQTDKHFGVIVSDCQSADIKELRQYTRKNSLKLIEHGANLGFAGGNNPGIKEAFSEGADWVLVINPDTTVEVDFISRLKNCLGPRTGIVGLPMMEAGKKAYAGRVDWLQPRLSHVYTPIPKEDNELHYPIGGALAISKEAYEKVGVFDEEYFLYFEDVDYALKARALEVPVEFATYPTVFHGVSESTTKIGSPLLLRYHYRNALHFNFKRGAFLVKILTWFWSFLIIIKQVIKIATGSNRDQSHAILAGVLDFYQDKMGRIYQEKIKVGIECENIEDGASRWGVGHLTLNLLKEFSKNKALQEQYDLILYFKQTIPPDEFLKNPIFEKRVIGVKSFNLFYHILMPIRAMRDRLDWMFFPAYMLPPLYIRKSVVMLTGDVYQEYKHGSLPFRYKLAYRLFTNWAAKFAEKILTISEASKKEVIKFYDIEPARVFVSHLGVETTSVETENKNGGYILYVGQMFPRRSALESILAFEKIAPDFPDLKFILIGKDKYNPPLIDKTIERINNQLGSERIIHHNYIESDQDVRAFYAHAKLFIYISSHEAFGLPLVEAASYEVPVVAKDSEINHELFGDAAFFVKNEKDINELADILKEAIANKSERQRMIKAYKQEMPKYSWDRFASNFFANLNA